jgi:DMSO/TMAO reductase YedYZ molybdopterin-dependent catalytic subunit
MLIPGFIGGRMVKWLCHITVTEQVRPPAGALEESTPHTL